jgi:cytochrome c biogenesis protein
VSEGGGTVIDKRPIVVNDPLTYKGITFYQSSYGPAGEGTYSFRVTERASGQTVQVTGREKQHIQLPGGASLIPLGYAESYQSFGPAAQISIDSGNHQHGPPFIVLKNYPNLDEQRGGPYIVSLLGFEQRHYTGLQVGKDPGVWVVWAGCFLMVVGSMVAFFLSHRRIWVVLAANGEQSTVKLGGSAHRNQPAFEIFFDSFKQDLKQRLCA